MKLKNRLIRIFFNKNVISTVAIFLLSATNFYGGIYPFGVAAFSAWGNNLFHVLAYFAGSAIRSPGVIGFLRCIVAFTVYAALKHILRKAPDFVNVGLASLVAGICSLLAVEDFFPYLYFVLYEALLSSVFTFIFRKSKEVLRSTPGEESRAETDFAFLVITVLCIFLSFSDIDTGRVSVSSTLMLFAGMVSGYKHRPSVSVAVNMAAGFFTMLFTPENVASVAYLTISGFTASILKKHGKFMIPLTYMTFFPMFTGFKINVTSYYLEDVVASSLLFLTVPGKVMEYINIIPGTDKKEASCLKLSERINILSDTLYSISEVFSGIEMRTSKKDSEDASELTVNEVCDGCYLKGRCSEENKKILKSMERKNSCYLEERINCNRKRELLASFFANYRIIRMENMLENHIIEGNSAMANQMLCMAGMLKDVCCNDEIEIFRNEAAESEIVSALKRKGIKVKRIVAGRSGKGVFRIILELMPCKKSGLCDGIVKETISEVLGFEVMRYGMKNCSACRVSYTEVFGFKIEKALAQASVEKVSGDSSKFSYVNGEHFAVALSDGMGTGAKAKYKSEAATELALRLLSAGMDLKTTVSMVNSLLLRQSGNDFATLDVACINLETGEVEFSKNAAASGYILRCGGKVEILPAKGSPIGIVGTTETKTEKCRIRDGDCLILVSDGVADCFGEEEKLSLKIGEFTAGSASCLADFIMTEAVKINSNKIKDDMTVIAVGCIKKQKSGKDSVKGGLVYEKRQKSYYIGQH